jgi:ADP-heptose:LPS heptosyltransferase
MGLGGDLMFSAVVREIKKAYPNKNVYLVISKSCRNKIIPFFKRKKLSLSPVFQNNPYISKGRIRKGSIIINRMDPRNHYIQEEFPDRDIFKDKRHVVELICLNYGVIAKSIKPDLFFTSDEEEKISIIVKEIHSPFLVVEPNGKTDYTENRSWFFDRWQMLVDKLSKDIKVVQVGDGSGNTLQNVIDYNGKLTFREAALLIKQADLFVSTIGGLMHAARAVDTSSIILYSGYESPVLAGYPENINFSRKVECAPCGLKTECPQGRKCMGLITVDDVYRIVISHLKKTKILR